MYNYYRNNIISIEWLCHMKWNVGTVPWRFYVWRAHPPRHIVKKALRYLLPLPGQLFFMTNLSFSFHVMCNNETSLDETDKRSLCAYRTLSIRPHAPIWPKMKRQRLCWFIGRATVAVLPTNSYKFFSACFLATITTHHHLLCHPLEAYGVLQRRVKNKSDWSSV